MTTPRLGFIGLGNVGASLAGNLLRHGADLTVRDLDEDVVAEFVANGARRGTSPRAMMEACDIVITCLPSPAISAAVVEGPDGLLEGMGPGKALARDEHDRLRSEIKRLAPLVEARGGTAMDCPVSGGCHRAATGNISIFAGGSREAFERALPVLAILGHQILHTGPIGSASMLKVLTNYLCTVHLVALAEALTTAKVLGLDMNTAYEAIRISSGNSFVHETESQVILNGSRDIGFTMDLVIKDVGLVRPARHRPQGAARAVAAGAGHLQGRGARNTDRARIHRTSSGATKRRSASRCWAPASPPRWSTTTRKSQVSKSSRRTADCPLSRLRERARASTRTR